MRNRNILWIGIAVVLVIIFALFISNKDSNKNTSSSNSKPVTAMNVGHINLANALPAFVAQEKGYFAQENLKVTFKKFTSSKLATDALYTGSIDASAGSSTVPLLGAEASQPGKAKIYALGYTDATEKGTLGGFLVKKDSTIVAVSDLNGKKIAVFPGGTAKILLSKYLTTQNVDPSTVQFVEQLPNLWSASLASGAVDAVYAYEPQFTIMKADQANPVRVLTYASLESVVNPLYLGGATLTQKFITNHKDAASAYIRAYYKGIDYIKSNEADARNILAKYTGISPQVTRNMNLYPDAKLDQIEKPKFQELADFLYTNQNITAKVDTYKMYVDPSLTK